MPSSSERMLGMGTPEESAKGTDKEVVAEAVREESREDVDLRGRGPPTCKTLDESKDT